MKQTIQLSGVPHLWDSVGYLDKPSVHQLTCPGSISDWKCALYFLSWEPVRADLIGPLSRHCRWVSGPSYSLKDTGNDIARNEGNSLLLIKVMWMSHRHIPFRFHQATLHTQDCSFKKDSPHLFSTIDVFRSLRFPFSPSKLNLSVLHFHRVHTTVFDTDIQGRLERSCLTQGNDVAFLALHHGTGWHCPLWAANAWEVPISGQTTSGLFVGFTPSNYSSALTINHSICVVSQLSDHKPLIPILLWLNPNPTYPTFPSLHHKPIAIPASFYAFWWCPRCGFFDHVIPHPAAPSLEGLRIAVFGQACGVPVAHRRLDAQLLAFGEHNSNFCDWIYKCLYILDIWYIYIYLIYIWYIMINLYLYSMGLGLENII